MVEGNAEAPLLVSRTPITFLGGVDPFTGLVVEKGHPLYGQSVSGKILVFPYSKGSTVGSYILLRLSKRGLAPAGIVTSSADEVTVIGCLISNIPMMSGARLDAVSELLSGRTARLTVTRSDARLEILESGGSEGTR
ncbi:aconitase X swivel domain-containing protein [Thermofilum pendens]|uniref:phosphomevalonate dehydratase n=1 Tax=Thermofilum pendens (strain DSM 2475 / Hrk 5) TaxID=368408 RepID=A1RYB9_THEPD|nr:DUF126 domain-containing protein [Thermofilum pendens]ABL78199.1 protein of unknown function DUF126 [Thermofilum pendens Hrk 5]